MQSALPFKSKDGTDLKKPPRPALPTDKVRFVGDPIACVVAETLLQAKDAAEAIERRHRAAAGRDHAGAGHRAGAPALFEDVPGNICLDFHYGDGDKVAAAFAGASHKVKLDIRNTRMIVNTIEPRAAIGSYDKASERFTLYSVSQGVMGTEGRPRRRDEGHAGQDARDHRQRRRLVRHEGAGLSGIHLHPARREARSAGR